MDEIEKMIQDLPDKIPDALGRAEYANGYKDGYKDGACACLEIFQQFLKIGGRSDG